MKSSIFFKKFETQLKPCLKQVLEKYFFKILQIHYNDTGDNLICKFGFANNREDITGETLRDAHEKELKDASKKNRYAGKQ